MNIEHKRFTESEKQAIQKYVLQGVQDGATLKQIKERLEKEAGIEITNAYLSVLSRKVREQVASASVGKVRQFTEAERVRRTYRTAAERLYYARGNVIDLKNKGSTNEEIAEKYHVAVSDVEEFLLKRKWVSPEQYREIVYKSTKGASPEELASEYGLSAPTVSKILTTKQRPISRDVEQEEAQWELDLEVARNFIKFINTLMTCKEVRTDLAERLNAERLDILHELEMKELTQEEKLAMLDKIADLGRRRREAKDYNEIFAPVTEFLADAANMNLIKVFANRVAEAVNKVKDLDMRVYFMRGSGE